ncbi:MerR family transcriptional regulator, partial [Nocardia farcinica]|uniref:MerR family transcriptional regulator n=1 Tax=Nocardia farcinica TaxID=37329 RepID=UPI0024540C5F
MTETRDQGLLTIGAVARATGLTASALRFYGDCGLLAPAVVDEVTGYRYYTPEQCARAVLIRRLRGIELPLPEVAEVLDAGAARAGEVLDRHVAELARRGAGGAPGGGGGGGVGGGPRGGGPDARPGGGRPGGGGG